MTYSVTLTTTKPESVAWFNDIDPVAVASFNEWLPTNAGFISASKEVKTSTTLVKTLTFETQANYEAYVQAKKINQHAIARKNYNKSNGIVTTSQVL